MEYKRSIAALVLLTGTVLIACTEGVPTPTDVPTRTAPSFSPTYTATAASTPNLAPPTSTASRTPDPPPTRTATARPTRTATSTSTSNPKTPTPACQETRGSIQSGTFNSTVIGQKQPYRVYLPPCYEFNDDLYPVLYILHGYPFDDSHWDEIGIDEAADAGIADGAIPPLIIAMPSADNEGTYTNTSGGPDSFEAVMLDEFIPFIETTFRVLPASKGRAIGGMSRGGVWSLEIAFRHPDHFAAVGGHSVALNVNRAPPIYDPLYLAADPAIRSLRIYLDSGDGDWALPGMQELHAALNAANVAHAFNVFAGYHDDSYWSAHVKEYLAFYTADW